MKHLGLLPLLIGAMLATSAEAEIASVKVKGGALAGEVADGVSVYKGIPFAAPPIGDLRWKAPRKLKPWKGVLAASDFAPGCMQDTSFSKIFVDREDVSEDCLYLNVWTPAASAKEKLPVMVWIYGGGFAIGRTSTPIYDGANLAKKGVVFVSIAYRVGPLGFMAHPELTAEAGGASGNYGLMDQIAGLKWVKANIAKFGGDPGNVTIFGESAGAISVSTLAASPMAKGLFHKAISESGGNFSPPRGSGDDGGLTTRSLQSAEEQGVALLAGLGVHDLKSARALPADAITKVGGPMGTFWPTYDGRFLPRDQYRLYEDGQFNDTPILIGTNSDEGALFQPPTVTPADYEAAIRAGYGEKADEILALYPYATDAEARQASANIFRETAFAWPTWVWARLQAQKGDGAVYSYYFDYKTPRSPNGANHADEMRFVFGNYAPPWGPATERDEELTAEFMGYWTNFAKTGNPNGPGLAEWPRFTTENQEVMGLGDKTGAMEVPNLTPLTVFDDYYAWRRKLIEAQ